MNVSLLPSYKFWLQQVLDYPVASLKFEGRAKGALAPSPRLEFEGLEKRAK